MWPQVLLKCLWYESRGFTSLCNDLLWITVDHYNSKIKKYTTIQKICFPLDLISNSICYIGFEYTFMIYTAINMQQL